MASYPIPPWLVPAQTADQYTRGAQIGAQVGSANAARAMEAQQFAARMQAQQAMAAAEAERADREYAFRKAQADAEMAIRQQTAQQIAAREAVRMQAVRDLETDIAGGMAYPEAYAKNFAKLSIGESMAGLPTVIRNLGVEETAQAQPREMEIGGVKFPGVQQPSGYWTPLKPPTAPNAEKLTPQQQQQLRILHSNYSTAQSEVSAIQKLAAQKVKTDPTVVAASIQKLKDAEDKLNDFILSLSPKQAETAVKRYVYDPSTGGLVPSK